MMGAALDRCLPGCSTMVGNEAYVLKANPRLLEDDILEGFPDSAILRIDIVLFCFFPYIIAS